MPGMEKTMHEYKEGTLHSGSKHGPKVKSRAQAIAIGLSEERAAHKKGNTDRHAHMAMDGSISKSHHDACVTAHSQMKETTDGMQHMMQNGLMDREDY